MKTTSGKNSRAIEKKHPPDALKARALAVWKILKKTYPDAGTALQHRDPFELLVATILSAQCTDERVNMVTQDLFKKYRAAEDYISAPAEELENDIRSTGFYKNKAKSIRGAAKKLIDDFGGKVPCTLEELTTLPGVGRKTANVILGHAFGIPGITVDTHVGRVSRRIGLTKNEDPVKVEFDLMDLIPKKDWSDFSSATILHGRRICQSRKPDCPHCPASRCCDYFLTQEASDKS